VEASEPVSLTGSFDGRPLRWVAEEPDAKDACRFWALAGVHALAEPGLHPLLVEATDGEGQRWAVNVEVFVQGGDFETARIVLPPAASRLLEPELLRGEQERLAAVWGQSSAQPLWQGTFVAPVRPFWPITSAFGQRRAYNSGPASSYHEGVDYGAKQGALVLAPAAGRVVLAEALTVRGNAVILDHGAGVHTGYWHLWQIFVEEGDAVRQGDPLGRVGNTGLSTGAHLHWELRVGDVAVDPLPWTQAAMPCGIAPCQKRAVT
jgi:murein DD-endopeptidase MepM/ murein hydrolase activator NlpD